MDQNIQSLQEHAGVIFDGFNAQLLPTGKTYRDLIGMDSAGGLLAMDAAYPLVTTANAGIPAMLSTYIDPKQIEVILSPLEAVTAVGAESKKGDWTTRTAMFPVIENTGEVTSYGDYNNSGSTGVNFQFPQRQSYHYQTITQWGERELAETGLAKIDLAARKNMASVDAINRYQNKTYLFGVAGLQNYGMLNDPALPADITPTTKAAGGTAWLKPDGSYNATALEIQADITKMYSNLQSRLKGNINRNSPMTLIMSPTLDGAMTATNEFNVNVADLLKKNYPGIKIVTVPEYETAAGQKVQLVVDEIRGQRTWECQFTEKMRAHPIVTELSAYKQKKSGGTWGTLIYMPMGVTSMLGL